MSFSSGPAYQGKQLSLGAVGFFWSRHHQRNNESAVELLADLGKDAFGQIGNTEDGYPFREEAVFQEEEIDESPGDGEKDDQEEKDGERPVADHQ